MLNPALEAAKDLTGFVTTTQLLGIACLLSVLVAALASVVFKLLSDQIRPLRERCAYLEERLVAEMSSHRETSEKMLLSVLQVGKLAVAIRDGSSNVAQDAEEGVGGESGSTGCKGTKSGRCGPTGDPSDD